MLEYVFAVFVVFAVFAAFAVLGFAVLDFEPCLIN
jgi:hypothetical protein